MTRSYLARFKRGTIVPVFDQFELDAKKERIRKRKDEITEQFYDSIATKVMESMI